MTRGVKPIWTPGHREQDLYKGQSAIATYKIKEDLKNKCFFPIISLSMRTIDSGGMALLKGVKKVRSTINCFPVSLVILCYIT